MRRPGHHPHQRGRSSMLWPMRAAGGSSPLIALIALMFLGQLVIISYMRAHNNCNTGAGGSGQPLSLVRSDMGVGGHLADDGLFGGTGEDDEVAAEDDDPNGLMAGLDDDDYEPIVGEDGVWGDVEEEEDDDGGAAAAAADEKTPKGYEEDLLPRIKKPMIVGCISTMRTVSTTAFNLARVLMEHVDPNSISGWENDFISSRTKMTIKDVVAPAKGKVGVVYKAHNANQRYHDEADFFVSTYRDPYDIMCSMGHMFVPKVFSDRHFAVEKCAKIAQNENRLIRLARARGPGKSLHIDSNALHSLEGMTAIAEKLIELWGVEGGPVNAKAIAMEVLALKSPDPGIFPVAHPRTELHAHHITKSNRTKGDCERIRPWLEADERCRTWRNRYLRMFPEGGMPMLDDVSDV